MSKKASCCLVQKPQARMSRRAPAERLAVLPWSRSPSYGSRGGSTSTSRTASRITYYLVVSCHGVAPCRTHHRMVYCVCSTTYTTTSPSLQAVADAERISEILFVHTICIWDDTTTPFSAAFSTNTPVLLSNPTQFANYYSFLSANTPGLLPATIATFTTV